VIEIIRHRTSTIHLIAIPLAGCPHVYVCVLIAAIDIGDSSKADVLCSTANKLATNNTAILCIAANVRSRSFGVLSGTRTAHCFIMSGAAISACHNDFTAMKGSVDLFQLVN